MMPEIIQKINFQSFPPSSEALVGRQKQKPNGRLKVTDCR